MEQKKKKKTRSFGPLLKEVEISSKLIRYSLAKKILAPVGYLLQLLRTTDMR